MIILILISVIIGAIVGGLTGISLIGWIAGIFFFVCGLPGVLISMFVDDRIDYVQDREDYRQLMHELDEDARMDRYLDKLDKHDTYIDNRQIHLHKHYDEYEDDLLDDLDDEFDDDDH